MPLKFEKALPEESEFLTELAHRSKRHWGYNEEWIELWRTGLTFTTIFIASHHVIIAKQDGNPAGVYALVPKDGGEEMEHFWVLPEYMMQGIGRAMIEHAKASARSRGIRRIYIVSDPHAEGFYVKMGAYRIGEMPSKPEGRRLPCLLLELDEPIP